MNALMGFINRVFQRTIAPLLSDESYLKLNYRMVFGRKLNLKNPKTMSEKLQWLKLYDRKPEYSMMVDKCDAKKFVSSIIGDEYIIPTYGVWDRSADIEWDKLPNQFVFKCTHDSGGIIIVKDKDKANRAEIGEKLDRMLKRNYYRTGGREWPYKNVKPRIMAEQFMISNDTPNHDIPDYKFFSFNGEPRVLLFCTERKNGSSKWDFYDMEMQRINVAALHHETTNLNLADFVSREVFEKMKEISRALAKVKAYVSVDLYYINGQIYFGELTFFSGGGWLQYNPADFDLKLGEMLTLPNK